MKIEGYVGICRVCFEPIKEGSEIQFREKGSFFHRLCAEKNPNSYYLALERIRGQFEKDENPDYLMSQMEQIFKIPMLDDPIFNKDNDEVIKLYREISNSRGI